MKLAIDEISGSGRVWHMAVARSARHALQARATHEPFHRLAADANLVRHGEFRPHAAYPVDTARIRLDLANDPSEPRMAQRAR